MSKENNHLFKQFCTELLHTDLNFEQKNYLFVVYLFVR